MLRLLIALIATVACTSVAYADSKPSADEAAKLKAALTEWGCEGGTFEKETEASGLFEVDDAKCKGMQYDLKFDSAYKLVDMTRD